MLPTVITFALTLLLPTSLAAPAQSRSSKPVRWLTYFGEAIEANTEMQLTWKGGNGHGWEVYYIPEWEGQDNYWPIFIERNTTATSTTWKTPKLEEWPKGTTFILGVTDGTGSLASDWYDLTSPLKFVNKHSVADPLVWAYD